MCLQKSTAWGEVLRLAFGDEKEAPVVSSPASSRFGTGAREKGSSRFCARPCARSTRSQGATAGFVTHSRPDVYHKPCLFIALVAAIARSDSGQKLQQMDNQQQQA